MSIKDQFSAQEWSKVLAAPMMAGNAVVAAAPSGPIGFIKEVGSMASAMVKMTEQSGNNELVQAVLSEIKAAAEKFQRPELAQPDAKDIEGYKQQALAMVQETATLVDGKVAPDVAKGYKEFVLAMAQKAAEAAKEGGFLGFGGTQISESEQAMFNQVKSTLGI